MLRADHCPGDRMTNDRNRGDPAGHPRKAARPAADAGRRPPELMTTREVADYLRLKERKVYDLVAGGEIPVSRATGKLLTGIRSEEHTSELQSLMRISYAVFCLKKENQKYMNFDTYIMIKINQVGRAHV